MKIEQIYTGCLAQGAYYITSNGEAAIIDPLRETAPYTDRLSADNVKLKYIFETHFHADFVSGHLDLSTQTGAKIVYGPTAKPEFDIISAEDNQIFKVGNIKIKVLHTPGHTMESTCYLLIDENGKDTALFSGDTLFIGDVGAERAAWAVHSRAGLGLAGVYVLGFVVGLGAVFVAVCGAAPASGFRKFRYVNLGYCGNVTRFALRSLRDSRDPPVSPGIYHCNRHGLCPHSR